MLLLEWCVRFATAGRCCRVRLQGAAAGCYLTVLLLEWCARYGHACGAAVRVRFGAGFVGAIRVLCGVWSRCRLQGCQSVMCVVELGWWCRSRLAPLQGVAARCLWQCGCWGPMEITFTPCQKRSVFGCCPKISFSIWGLCWRKFLKHLL